MERIKNTDNKNVPVKTNGGIGLAEIIVGAAIIGLFVFWNFKWHKALSKQAKISSEYTKIINRKIAKGYNVFVFCDEKEKDCQSVFIPPKVKEIKAVNSIIGTALCYGDCNESQIIAVFNVMPKHLYVTDKNKLKKIK
jgi:hypothetical protein